MNNNSNPSPLEFLLSFAVCTLVGFIAAKLHTKALQKNARAEPVNS